MEGKRKEESKKKKINEQKTVINMVDINPKIHKNHFIYEYGNHTN